MKRVLYVLVAILLMAGLMAMAGCGGGGTPGLDQSQTSTPGNTGLEGDWWLSQGFVPSMPMLTSVEVYIGSVHANLNEPLTLQIRGDSNGLPSSSVLASTSVTITRGAWGWITFDIPDLAVNPGTRYHLVLSSASNYHAGLDSTNPYPGGYMGYSTDAGITWKMLHDSPNYDMAFKIYCSTEQETAEGETANSSPVANAGSNQSVQVGDIVTFSGTGTDADGSIAKYEWDFDGDGIYDWSSGTTGSTTHIYDAAGTYTAVLRVTDNEGAADTDTCTITVTQKTIDITGTWSGNWWRSDGGEEGTLIATLTQIGGSLSGDMTVTSTTFSYSKDTTVSGSVEGSDVVFGMAISSNGSTVTIDYEGTISEDGDQMSGTYSMSTGYTGTWSATRTTTTPTTTTPTTTTPAPTTTTPAPTTTTPTGEDIAILSSNVFTTTSSILLDGEHRRLHIVAQLRNDSSVDMDLGHIYFHFYNASGEVVCKRWAYAFDDILPPGGITVVEETVPSQMYWDSETNNFPEDWARYEITINAQPASGTRKPVEVTIQNVEVTVTSTGGLEVTGSVLNSSQETVKNVKPYVILYASDGTVLNADRDLGISELDPGESQDFLIRFLAGEPIDYDHYIVKACAERW